MNSLYLKFRKSIIIDSALLITINAGLFVIFLQIDFLETVHGYLLELEEYELDEIIPLSFTLSVSLLIFIVRRYFELKVIFKETESLSVRDPLTGLYNRRYIENMFNIEVEQAKKNMTPISLLIIDIDDFKKINDQYSHSVGDKVLIQFSSILQSVIREVDVASRWGGEEFLILCPDKDINQTILTAQQLLKDINSIIFGETLSITASIGVVAVNNNEQFEAAVHRADEYLYKAKHKGKNCYVSS